MTPNARDVYQETQVLTATPQKLRLMLIEGALRFAQQAIACWDQRDQRAVRCNALARCHDVLIELYGSVRADQLPVASQVKALYRFLFRHLAEATATDDCQKVREIVRVLEQERETWRQLCTKMPAAPPRAADGPLCDQEITARDCLPLDPPPPASLSLEA